MTNPPREAAGVPGNPNAADFAVPNIGLKDQQQQARLETRLNLRRGLDRLRRDLDQWGNMQALDAFETQAWNLLAAPETARAFDVSQEPPAIRERYGRNAWGQQCLLARRLVEAGVELVTVTLNGELCGRVAIQDFSGRPIPILQDGRPISELTAQ